MNILILIIIGIIGIALGYYLASRGAARGGGGEKFANEADREKEERKEKILAHLHSLEEIGSGEVNHDETNSDTGGRGKITNNDVEELFGVSNTSAERYLNELEKEGKLTQHGSTGRSVFYTLK